MDTRIKQGTRNGRPNYSMEYKRRLAIAACAPDVSVSKLALAHEVNTNMVFKWRRQYRAGLLGNDIEPAFLPVAVVATASCDPSTTATCVTVPSGSGMIEIEVAGAIVRVHGGVDSKALRTVIQSLRA